MLRIIGAILVAGGMTSCGILAVWKMNERIRAISGIISSLDTLQAEICFNLTNMPDLMKLLAKNAPAPVASFFDRCSGKMHKLGDFPFSAIWAKEVKDFFDGYLKPQERDALTELGNVLGKYDTDGQARAIASTRRRFEAFLTGAELEKSRQGRVYGALGVTCGLMAVIILF